MTLPTLKLSKLPLEGIIWLISLVGLFFTYNDPGHFTICPLSLLDLTWCPGCGIGHAIGYAMHGRFNESLEAHPLGIFALAILTHRIFQLTRLYIKNYGKNY